MQNVYRQKGEKIFRKKVSTTILKTVWKVVEKDEGEGASCEKTAEAANREHQTN